jgi:hypothetical protein
LGVVPLPDHRCVTVVHLIGLAARRNSLTGALVCENCSSAQKERGEVRMRRIFAIAVSLAMLVALAVGMSGLATADYVRPAGNQ